MLQILWRMNSTWYTVLLFAIVGLAFFINLYLSMFLGGFLLIAAVIGGVLLPTWKYTPYLTLIASSYIFFSWYHDLVPRAAYIQGLVFYTTLAIAIIAGREIRSYIAEIERQHEENDKLNKELIYSFITAIDAKDDYLHNHSHNVSWYARKIAEEIGLAPEKCRQIAIAGVFHDIGKIYVSADILNKPEKLTDEEWQRMQKHPSDGAKILKNISRMQDVLPAIKYHHRHFDGKGYPQDCQNKDIPIDARIIAVADAFDAMTSNRPYREALSTEEAYAELKKHSGTQFDPFVVKAFFACNIDVIDEPIDKTQMPVI